MASNHYDQWIFKSILGFTLIIASVFLTFYSIAYLKDTSRWVLYAVLVSVTLGIGVSSVCSAFVHKMKHDIRHRQKAHEHQKES
ncbi:MAG: hypothetical protein SFU20_15335 [Chitinophagaceae bacterium]|nr:hypothetical protein [Chitinophagaceae bacterium]